MTPAILWKHLEHLILTMHSIRIPTAVRFTITTMHRAVAAVRCWLYCRPLLDRKSIPYGLGGTLDIEAVGGQGLPLQMMCICLPMLNVGEPRLKSRPKERPWRNAPQPLYGAF